MPPIPVPSFLELPAELKIQVFIKLPARQIAQGREISRAIRNFVESNAQHIFATVHQRELSRLQDFARHNINYDNTVTFLEALSRWSRNRGWSSGETDHDETEDIMSIGAFILHWAKLKTYPDVSVATLCNLHRQATIIWRLDYALLRSCNGSLSIPRAEMDAVNFASTMTSIGQNPIRITHRECEDMYAELRDTPGGRISGHYRADACTLEHAIPKHLITDIRFYTGPHKAMSRSGCVPLSYLVATFGVPVLPWGSIFAYYVSEETTVKLIRQAYSSNLALSALQKAAVVEALGIY